MFALGITFVDDNTDTNFFLCYNVRWIFAVSSNYHLLEAFAQKIVQYTSEYRRQYLVVEIIPFNSLGSNEIAYNNMSFPYQVDKIYVEGIVNLEDGPSYYYEEFKKKHWNL